MEAQWQQQQQQLRRGRQSNREAKRKERAVCGCVCFFILSLLPVVGLLLLFHPAAFEAYRLTVHVASLSLSLSPATPSPSVVSRNWSVALSVKNSKWGHRLGWDHAQVMLFYGHEFVAGTFLEKFSVAPEGEEILETGGEAGAAVFSRDVGEWVARAMAKDGEDGGVMELTVSVLRHDGRSRYWTGWDGFICRGLKVGFSSQNQRQVGSLLSGSQYKCT